MLTCKRCGAEHEKGRDCRACGSCHHCDCCPCNKVGCKLCPFGGRREEESIGDYCSRLCESYGPETHWGKRIIDVCVSLARKGLAS
jgi:hypothetical protein